MLLKLICFFFIPSSEQGLELLTVSLSTEAAWCFQHFLFYFSCWNVQGYVTAKIWTTGCRGGNGVGLQVVGEGMRLVCTIQTISPSVGHIKANMQESWHPCGKSQDNLIIIGIMCLNYARVTIAYKQYSTVSSKQQSLLQGRKTVSNLCRACFPNPAKWKWQ